MPTGAYSTDRAANIHADELSRPETGGRSNKYMANPNAAMLRLVQIQYASPIVSLVSGSKTSKKLGVKSVLKSAETCDT
jgi:hypothetical protein